MSPSFIHLHLHSEYSLTDSIIRVPELVRRCVELGLPAVALTDQSNLFALVKFYREAEKAGVKPIAGADVWMTEDGMRPSRLTLLCQNHAGYLNLSRLLSRAYQDGHHGDYVAIRPEWLRQQHEGLIVLAGQHSDVGQIALEGRQEVASARVEHWQRAFGDRYYLEVTRTQRKDESSFFNLALDLAQRRDCALAASNDVRFLMPSVAGEDDGNSGERRALSDFEAHEARACIASGRTLADSRRPRDYSPEQYLKSAEEMAELFADHPAVLANTVEIAKRCNLELTFGKAFLPSYPVPAQHDPASWLRESAHAGLAERLSRQPLAPGRRHEDYVERLDIELDVIVGMDFPGYFLIVADFINWAKQNDIPVGPGRGSGAGSLVAWALGITDLDPLPYDLLFERFLNPERVSMPDFDIDFCMDRRDRVIDYVRGKYGEDRVAQIITYGTMAAKAAVRDCGRVLGLPYGFVDGIAKLIPTTLGISLDDAMGESSKARENASLVSEELVRRYREEDDVRELIDLARKLEDLTRNAGKHAGGVVIAPSPLTDFSPLFAEHHAKGDSTRSVVTQFDKDDVEAVGLVKFDFLGLRTLTIIDWAVKAVNHRCAAAGIGNRESGIGNSPAPPTSPHSPFPIPGSRPFLDITTLPLDDRATYELFARGDTVAVFQFESPGMRKLIKQARPDRFEDIIALAALYRPGPLGSGMDKDWVARKHGKAQVSYPHPLLEPVLAPTYGVIVYQEQVMQIAQVLAGYSLGGADLLRRAMGKKKPEEMAKERAKFEAGCAERGIDAAVATHIFDLMEKFAEYGFNKSHSAAYALVAYQTAWLKQHYPAEFMAAVLSSDMDNTDKVASFLEDTRRRGITVLPPDVNASGHHFRAIDARTIRYGLGAVKGVGQGAIEHIVAARDAGGPFCDLFDFCLRASHSTLNRKVLEALIKSGSLDALAANRASLALQLPSVLRAVEQSLQERAAGQNSLFGGGSDQSQSSIHIDLPTCDELPLQQILMDERDALGLYLSGHPIDTVREELQGLVGSDLGHLDALFESRWDNRDGQVIGGLITGVRRRSDTFVSVNLEDGRGRIEVTFFGDTAVESAPILSRDRILIVEGSLREDEMSGGYTLRAKRCWDFESLYAEHAHALELDIDIRQPAAEAALWRLLREQRCGKATLKLTLSVQGGRGRLVLAPAPGLLLSPGLVDDLRNTDGVRSARPGIARPWAPPPSTTAD